MRRLWAACIGVAIIGASLAGTAQAVTLVAPSGGPLPAHTQTWAAHMHVASWRGTMVISPDWQYCAQSWNEAGLDACTNADGTIYWRTAPDNTQFSFYHELGHNFDARYLHWWDHWMLMRMLSHDIGMRLRVWDGDTTNYATESSYAREYFANAYANCAQADRVNEDPDVCGYINRIGRRAHASPPSVGFGRSKSAGNRHRRTKSACRSRRCSPPSR